MEAAGRALREAADQKNKDKVPAAGQKAAAAKRDKKQKKAKSGKKEAKKAGDKKAAKKAGGKKAGAKKAPKMSGEKKAAGKKAGNKKAGKKVAKKSGGKKSNKKKTGNKKAGEKNASKAKSGKKAQKDVKSVACQSCATDSTCLLAAGKYFQQVMVMAVNYKAQYTRINTFTKQATSKGGKMDDFAPVLNHMKELGGGNVSALSCGGSSSGQGANSLKAVVTNLGQCSKNISTACMTEAPSLNSSQANDCLYAIDNLTAGVANFTAVNGTAACACWKSPSLANWSATVANCDLSASNKNVSSLKSSCQTAYSMPTARACPTLGPTSSHPATPMLPV